MPVTAPDRTHCNVYDLEITVEWPAGGQVCPGALIRVLETSTGDLLPCEELHVYASAQALIMAEVTMLCDLDGKPLRFQGGVITLNVIEDPDNPGELLRRTYTALVTDMRIKS